MTEMQIKAAQTQEAARTNAANEEIKSREAAAKTSQAKTAAKQQAATERIEKEKLKEQKRHNRNTELTDAVNAGTKLGVGLFNDVAWYWQNAELSRMASSITYSGANGMATGEEFPCATFFPEKANAVSTVPGVCALGVQLIPGISKDFGSAVNKCASMLFTKLTAKNSRSPGYAPADVMMYLLAVDSLYARLSEGYRIYGLLNSYDAFNAYTPRALFKAMGLNYADFQKNRANLFSFLEYVRNSLGVLVVPRVARLFARHWWMFANVYKDGDGPKAQYYLFTPRKYAYYDTSVGPDGGEVAASAITYVDARGPSGNESFGNWSAAFLLELEKLLEDQSLAIIRGDILKAFATEDLYAISACPVDYKVMPQYSAEVLSQIENAFIFNKAMTSVVQGTNPNTAKFGCILTTFPSTDVQQYPNAVYPGNAFINARGKNTTPEATMVATRLQPHIQINTTLNTYKLGAIEYVSAGTELVLDMYLYYYETPDAVSSGNLVNIMAMHHYVANHGPWDQGLPTLPSNWMWGNVHEQLLTILSNFDWAPRIYFGVVECTIQSGESGPEINPDSINLVGGVCKIQDADFYGVASGQVIDKMHQAATLSEFGVALVDAFTLSGDLRKF